MELAAGCVPDIRLFGDVNDDLFGSFRKQLDKGLKKEGPLIFELTTLGGDAETARRIVLDIQVCREQMKKEIYFLGKTVVYSAGMTILGAFPKQYRYLTRDTVLLIHERRLERKIDLDGQPLGACAEMVQRLSAQIRMAQELEAENFRRIAGGSAIDASEVAKRAAGNWYLRAAEALELGLVGGLV